MVLNYSYTVADTNHGRRKGQTLSGEAGEENLEEQKN